MILSIVGIILILFAGVVETKNYYGAGLVGAIGGACLTLSISMSKEKEFPTALDVYQGKTTLEITYHDSIPVDTVVIFKNKKQ